VTDQEMLARSMTAISDIRPLWQCQDPAVQMARMRCTGPATMLSPYSGGFGWSE
jgi:hypothetical protein